MMLEFARVFLFVFGLATVGGGVMGFVKANSKPSLIAGGLAGALLLLAGWLAGRPGRAGWILGFVVSLALAGRFVSAFAKTKKPMPAGMMAALSVIGVALTALVLAGVG